MPGRRPGSSTAAQAVENAWAVVESSVSQILVVFLVAGALEPDSYGVEGTDNKQQISRVEVAGPTSG